MRAARIALLSRPPAVRSTGSTNISITKCFAAWPTPPFEPMRTSCCTFYGGGRVFTTRTRSPGRLTETTLLDYVRFQSSQERELTGATINQRVAIVDRALHIIFPELPHQTAPALQTTYWQRAPMG